MPTAATAHDVFEINACHGNKFENSCQTTCQLQYILVGLLYYSTWDVHWKKNNLPMCLWLVVCTCWQQRTLRAYWLLCGMGILFYISPLAYIKPPSTFFSPCYLSFQADIADTLSSMTIIHLVEKLTALSSLQGSIQHGVFHFIFKMAHD